MFNRLYRFGQAAKIGGAVLMSALLLWATSGVQIAHSQASLGPVRSQHRKPVGPVPIGMLYVDHEWDGGAFKLKPGYYQLKVTHYLWWLPEVVCGLWLTAEDEETITVIGEVSSVEFTPERPKGIVQSFTVGKRNPVWFAIALGVALLFTGGCTVNVQQCQQGAVCGQQNNNNPPPPPPPPPPGGGG